MSINAEYNLGINISMRDSYTKSMSQLQSRLEGLNGTVRKVADELERSSLRMEQAFQRIGIETQNASKRTTELSRSTRQAGDAASKAAKKVDKSTHSVKQHGHAIKETDTNTVNWLSNYSKALSVAVKSTFLWAGATTAIYGTKRALQSASQALIEINAQMVSLERVMNENITNFDEMKNAAADLAVDFAADINDVLTSMVQWGRQGREQVEILKLTEAAILGTNVAQMDAEASVGYLTAAILQFNMSADESIEIIDRWNNVANNFATTATDLAMSIQQAGSAANAAGVSMDELIGMTTALTASTAKSGNEIGRMLRTTFSRLIGSGEEGAEALSKVETELNSIGIALRINEDTFRSVTAILNDLANRWDGLTDVMRANIAFSLGGRRRYSEIIALIENWDIAIDATESSINSLNSAMIENEKYLDSLEARYQKARSALSRLIVTFGGEAGFEGVLKLVAGAMESTFNTMNKFVLGIRHLWEETVYLQQSIIALLIPAIIKLGAVLMANPVGAIIGVATIALTYFITKMGEKREMLERVKQTQKTLNEVMEKGNQLSLTEIRTAEEQINKYKELTDSLIDYQEAKKESVENLFRYGTVSDLDFIRRNKWFKDNIKELRLVFDELSDTYKDNEDFLDSLLRKMAEHEIAVRNSVSYLKDEVDTRWEGIQRNRETNHVLQKQIETYNRLSNATNLTFEESILLESVVLDLEKSFPKLVNAGEDFAEVLEKIGTESFEQFGLGSEGISEEIEFFLDQIPKFEDAIEDLEEKRRTYSAEVERLGAKLAEIDKDIDPKTYNDLSKELAEVEHDLRVVYNQIDTANSYIVILERNVESLNEEFSKDDIEQYKALLSDMENPLDNLIERFDNLKVSITDAMQALQVDLAVIDLFSAGSTRTEILEQQIGALESYLNDLQNITGELIDVTFDLDSPEEIVSKWEEIIGMEGLPINQQRGLSKIIEQSLTGDIGDLRSNINEVVGEIVDVLFADVSERISSKELRIVELMFKDYRLDTAVGIENVADDTLEEIISAYEDAVERFGRARINDIYLGLDETVFDLVDNARFEKYIRETSDMMIGLYRNVARSLNMDELDMELFDGTAIQNLVKSRKAIEDIVGDLEGVDIFDFTIDEIGELEQSIHNVEQVIRQFQLFARDDSISELRRGQYGHLANDLIPVLEILINRNDELTESNERLLPVLNEIESAYDSIEDYYYSQLTEMEKLEHQQQAFLDYSKEINQAISDGTLDGERYATVLSNLDDIVANLSEQMDDLISKETQEFLRSIAEEAGKLISEKDSLLQQIRNYGEQQDRLNAKLNEGKISMMEYIVASRQLNDLIADIRGNLDLFQTQGLVTLSEVMAGIAGRNFWDMPILDDDTPIRNMHRLSSTIAEDIDRIINPKITGDTSINELQRMQETLNTLVPQLRYAVATNEDLTEEMLFFDDGRATGGFQTWEELEEYIKNANKELEEHVLLLEQARLSEQVFNNYLNTLEKIPRKIIQMNNELENAENLLSELINDEDISKQEAYINWLEQKIKSLNEELYIDEELGFNEILEELTETLDDFDISEVLGLREANDYLDKFEGKLSITSRLMEMLKSEYKLGKGNISEETFGMLSGKLKLTDSQINEVIERLKGYQIEVEKMWYQSFANAIFRGIEEFNENEDLAKALGAGFKDFIENIDLELLNQKIEDAMSYIGTTFDFSDEIIGSVVTGLQTVARMLQGGSSLGRGISAGLGAAIGAYFGSASGGAAIGDLLGSFGEKIWGGIEGGDIRAEAELVDDSLKQVSERLKEYNIEMDYTTSGLEDLAGWWSSLWGGEDWVAPNLEEAIEDLEEMETILNRLDSTFSILAQGFATALKDSFNYTTFFQHFRQTIGQAMQNAIISSVLESQEMEAMFREIGTMIEMHMAGDISDTELKNFFDDLDSRARDSYDTVQEYMELINSEFGLDFDQSVSQSFQAGSTTNITYHNTFSVNSQVFMGGDEQAREAAEMLAPYIQEFLDKESGR